MNSLRRFLRPGWAIGLLAVVLFTYACFTVLAPWQLGKSEQLDERNSRLTESVQAPPIPLAEALASPASFTDREWHLVTVSGHWLPDAEVLLRLRQVDGDNVYQVLTVFRADDGEELLVNRGYVPMGENNAVPDYPRPPAGDVRITARLRAAEHGELEPIELHGRTMVRIVDPAVLGPVLGRDLVTDGFLQLSADQPGSLTPVPIPSIESGPYFSYGLQWIAFGILAPLALGYFAWSELRNRGREAPVWNRAVDDRPDPPAAADTGTPDGRDPGREAPTASTDGGADGDGLSARERALRERYGDRFDAERRYARRRGNRLGDR